MPRESTPKGSFKNFERDPENPSVIPHPYTDDTSDYNAKVMWEILLSQSESRNVGMDLMFKTIRIRPSVLKVVFSRA